MVAAELRPARRKWLIASSGMRGTSHCGGKEGGWREAPALRPGPPRGTEPGGGGETSRCSPPRRAAVGTGLSALPY